jgi:uncharacterized protein (DUF1330 family)
MAIISVLTLRVRDGKMSEVLENLKTVKRVVERAGGKYQVVQELFGAAPRTLSAISEYPDWNGLAKVRSDPDMQQLMLRLRDTINPSADPLAASIVEDVVI